MLKCSVFASSSPNKRETASSGQIVSATNQVSDGALALNQTVEENLVQLETAFQEQTDYVSIVQKLQGQLDELVRLMGDVPFWSNTDISLEDLARKTETFDFYRLVRRN